MCSLKSVPRPPLRYDPCQKSMTDLSRMGPSWPHTLYGDADPRIRLHFNVFFGRKSGKRGAFLHKVRILIHW